jgi:hypothetical protein
MSRFGYDAVIARKVGVAGPIDSSSVISSMSGLTRYRLSCVQTSRNGLFRMLLISRTSRAIFRRRYVERRPIQSEKRPRTVAGRVLSPVVAERQWAFPALLADWWWSKDGGYEWKRSMNVRNGSTRVEAYRPTPG